MCYACEINQKHDRIVIAEAIVAKALSVSELSQMAKLEQRSREYLDKNWETLRAKASGQAGKLAGQGKNAKSIDAAIKKIMGQWAKNVTPRFNKNVESVYKLARTVGWKKAKRKYKGTLAFDTPNFSEEEIKKAKASVGPSFDLADQEAISMLNESNTFWIGEHYDENVARTISSTTRETLAEAGASRRVAATLMAERAREALGIVVTPGGFHGTSTQYFEGLTANAMTVARTFGQMRSFGDIGITKYTIVNPQDSRTCKVCSHMDQKTFEVSQGYSQMQAELAASSPDEIKKIHPWFSLPKLQAISSTPGRLSGRAGVADSRNLSAAGMALPPFHFRCRCTVDIDPAVSSYDDLVPMEPPTSTPRPPRATPPRALPRTRSRTRSTTPPGFTYVSGDKVPKNVAKDIVQAMKNPAKLDMNLEGMRDLSQFRKALKGLSTKEINEIVTKMSKPPFNMPIRIDHDPNPWTGMRVYLKDGRHRLQAAREAGATSIQARIVTYDDKGGIKTDTISIIPTGGNLFKLVLDKDGTRMLKPR